MELIGKIYKIQMPESGTTKEGKNWVQQTVVIETMDQRATKMALKVKGDERVTEWIDAKEGDLVRCRCEVSSREHEGRWFSEITCWDVTFLKQS